MENTSEFIIETIAPIFNKKGYVGTSLSDLTKATKLTKGALYCNFKNKEELAIKAFRYNAKNALHPLFVQLSKHETSLAKLKTITNYYRHFYNIANKRGGCPILNIGIDAKHNSPALFNEAKKEASKLTQGFAKIIQNGIDTSEFNASIDAFKYARNFYAMIEGAVFMAMMYNDDKYLTDAMDLIDDIIEVQIKKR
ncbi:TetR/AcrR family transcriptional regulator [Aquimarina sediminis]|uniref:TetR/AcrR family transcriptional regulator n=1 Tax=Aquimarina sediminis TaxID=2070536 RepID=UPI000CA0712E|nr:TetR/AcrR family transcriptional regulator [Aquimarina sediminis]